MPTPTRSALTHVLTLACTLTAPGLLAAPIASYDFNGTELFFNDISTNAGNAAPFSADVAAGVTATNLAATGGGTLEGVRLGNNKLTYAQPLQGEVLLVGTAGTNAFSDDDYFSFTLTPDSGQVLDLTSITVQAARGGGSARGFRVKSSLDNFTTSLNDTATETIATERPTLTDYTVDLNAAAFEAVSGPIEFRVYVYSNFKDNTVEMDNLVVNGQVVPEPGSMALLSLSGLLLLRRRALTDGH